MTLYYMIRDDKAGNRLTTSYDSKDKAAKYGTGANLIPWTGVRYFDPVKGVKTDEPTGFIVRSALVVKDRNYSPHEGNFVIYTVGEDAGVYEPTPHRYATYGIANTAMKSFVGIYHDMIIVEEPKSGESVEVSNEPAPF